MLNLVDVVFTKNQPVRNTSGGARRHSAGAKTVHVTFPSLRHGSKPPCYLSCRSWMQFATTRHKALCL